MSDDKLALLDLERQLSWCHERFQSCRDLVAALKRSEKRYDRIVDIYDRAVQEALVALHDGDVVRCATALTQIPTTIEAVMDEMRPSWLREGKQ